MVTWYVCGKCGKPAMASNLVERRTKFGPYHYQQFKHYVNDKRKSIRYIYHYVRVITKADEEMQAAYATMASNSVIR